MDMLYFSSEKYAGTCLSMLLNHSEEERLDEIVIFECTYLDLWKLIWIVKNEYFSLLLDLIIRVPFYTI